MKIMMHAQTIRLIILATALCMSATGCGSLGGGITIVPAYNTDVRYTDLSPDALQMVQSNSQSFHVFNSNPYTLSLDVEEMEPAFVQTPVHGDGGVSLNAYAACLKLKVMF